MPNPAKIIQIAVVKTDLSGEEVLYALLEDGNVVKHSPPSIERDAESNEDVSYGDTWELLDPPTLGCNIKPREDQRERWRAYGIDPLKSFRESSASERDHPQD